MPYSESQKRATMKWDKENYDRVYLTVPKGMKQRIEAVAKEQGNHEMVRQYKDGERGYIVALRDCGLICNTDMRRLIVRYVQR